MKSGRKNSFVLSFAAVFILCFSIALSAWLKVGVGKKQQQYEELSEQVQELIEENERIDHLIHEADEAELYEHLARERGYLYTNEKVYHNVTPGN